MDITSWIIELTLASLSTTCIKLGYFRAVIAEQLSLLSVATQPNEKN